MNGVTRLKIRMKIKVILTVVCGAGALLPLLSNAQTVKKDIRYKSVPEGDLNLDLYYPDVKRPGKYPVVIYTHGGGWAAGSKNKAMVGNMAKVVRGLAENGFCVVAVDYRLYTEDGTVTIKDCVTDSKDAIRFLAKNSDTLNVDPNRVFTFGDSAGGQIAQMLLLSSPESLPGDPELVGCSYTTIAGVSWYGPCDFEKTELFNHDDRGNFRDRFGPRILKPDSKSEDKLALYREMSPINYLKKDSPPLLMIQGDGDTTIPVKHAYYMHKKAQALNAPVEIMIIKHAGHNWRMADGVTPIDPPAAQIVQRTVDFFVGHQ